MDESLKQRRKLRKNQRGKPFGRTGGLDPEDIVEKHGDAIFPLGKIGDAGKRPHFKEVIDDVQLSPGIEADSADEESAFDIDGRLKLIGKRAKREAGRPERGKPHILRPGRPGDKNLPPLKIGQFLLREAWKGLIEGEGKGDGRG